MLYDVQGLTPGPLGDADLMLQLRLEHRRAKLPVRAQNQTQTPQLLPPTPAQRDVKACLGT